MLLLVKRYFEENDDETNAAVLLMWLLLLLILLLLFIHLTLQWHSDGRVTKTKHVYLFGVGYKDIGPLYASITHYILSGQQHEPVPPTTRHICVHIKIVNDVSVLTSD